jgi:glucose-1-phosphate thymidylyltransferase
MRINALILAAGYAVRLHPLTIDTPKPLLPVAGRPLLDFMLDELRAIQDVGRVVVVTNHRFAAHFVAWADHVGRVVPWPVQIVDDGTTTNDDRLGAIGDIGFVFEKHPDLIDEPLFVLAGDNLVDFRLADLVATFRQHGGDSSVVALVRSDDMPTLRRSGVVTIGSDGRVIGFVEKPSDPPSDLVCPAFYVYGPNALARVSEYLASGEPADAPGNLVAWLHPRLPVYGHVFDQPRYDIGTLENYREVCAIFEARATAGAANSTP